MSEIRPFVSALLRASLNLFSIVFCVVSLPHSLKCAEQLNLAGNLTVIKDRNNNQTTISRSAANQRIEQVTDAEERSVAFNDKTGNIVTLGAYDSRGLPSTVTDPRGNVTTFGYEPSGRLWTVTDPLGKVTTLGLTQNCTMQGLTATVVARKSFIFNKASIFCVSPIRLSITLSAS